MLIQGIWSPGGKALNFLLLDLVEDGGVPMPGFFGYLNWVCLWRRLIFIFVTVVFLL